MYAKTEFKVVEVKADEELPGFGDYLLLRMGNSSPFEVYNYTHERLKKGDVFSGLLEGFGVSKVKSDKRGMRINKRHASAVGKIVELESWKENVQECTVADRKMRCRIRKAVVYRMLIDCKYFFVIVSRDSPSFKPKKGDRVSVRSIENVRRQDGELFSPSESATHKNIC